MQGDKLISLLKWQILLNETGKGDTLVTKEKSMFFFLPDCMHTQTVCCSKTELKSLIIIFQTEYDKKNNFTDFLTSSLTS